LFALPLYFRDSACSSGAIAQRVFEQNVCFDLLYDGTLPPEATCEISIDCFLDPYAADPEKCPHISALTVTNVLDNNSGVHVEASPFEACGTEQLLPIDYTFGECYFSDFYRGCYFQVHSEGREETDIINSTTYTETSTETEDIRTILDDDDTGKFIQLEYFTNDKCSSKRIAKRTFEHNICFNLLYDASLRPDEECEISIRCFQDPYGVDCPQISSLNSTNFNVYPSLSVDMVANPYEGCGTEILIPIEYVFGQCYRSDFYPSCYFLVSLEGGEHDYDNDDEQDLRVYYFGDVSSASSFVCITLVTVVILFVC